MALVFFSCVGGPPINEDPGLDFLLGLDIGETTPVHRVRQPGWPDLEKKPGMPTCSVNPPVQSSLGTLEVVFFAKCEGERHPLSGHCGEVGDCTDLYSVRIESSEDGGARLDDVLSLLTASWGKPKPDCGQTQISEDGHVCARWDRTKNNGIKASAMLTGSKKRWTVSAWVDELDYQGKKLEESLDEMFRALE